MQKNDEFVLRITDLTDLGSGVGRAPDGSAVFVPGTAPGDEILCHIIKVSKNYAVGRVAALRGLSPYRVTPDCAAFSRCGGCTMRHLSPEYELRKKREFVEAALRKEGLAIPVAPVLSVGKRAGYRNKVQLPVSPAGEIGYFAPHSHRVVECADCKLHHPALTPVIGALRRFVRESGVSCYDEQTGKGLLRHLFLRCNHDGSEIMVGLVINGETLPQSGKLLQILAEFSAVKSVFLSHNTARTNVILGDRTTLLQGTPTITDTLLGLPFAISPEAFYQVNHDGCELLYTVAAEKAALRPGERLIDLFCGIGTVGLTMAARTEGVTLTGIEIVPQAVENAKANAARCGMADRATFLCGDANHPALAAADVVVVDPPRAGLDAALVDTLAALAPDRIVYISCAADTLARDLRRFAEKGFTCSEIQPVDMFPGTGHVENVTLLKRHE